MKKLLTKIAGITAGIAMAVGVGAGISLTNKKANPLNAATNTDTYSMDDIISSSYQAYSNSDFVVTFGGGGNGVGVNNNATNWENVNLSSYAKYAVSPITTSTKATAVVMLKQVSHVTRLSFAYTGGTNCNSGKIYAIYSSDNSTFSQLTITSGTSQGTSLTTSSGSATFNFSECSGYFGIVISTTKTDGNWKYTGSTLSLTYEVSNYTVSYDANGGTGEMTDGDSPYSPGATVTVLPNEFTKSGYTFDHWNTAANNSGSNYDADDTFTINGNTTLFAQWTVTKYPCTDVDNKITWNLAIATYDTMTSTSATWVSTKASVSVSKSTCTTATNNWCPPIKTSTRLYTNSDVTISPESGYKIESIVFTATSNDYATTLANSSWTNATALASSSTVTVTPSIKPSDVEVTIGGTVGLTQIVINYSSYSPLDSIALSGTYPTEFTQGDAFSHEGMVVTATYENASNATVTSSAIWSGYNMASTGNQTVTVSYTEEGVTKTKTYTITVNAPVVPTIILSESSVAGYTGQDFTVTATYSNLTSAFSWGSPTGTGSISGSVTGTTGTSTNGTSTYSGTLTGAGSVTLATSGGGVAEAPSVEFAITLSTVTITGLPVSDIIGVGDNLNLGSLIAINATGSYSNDVTWSTSEESVATVSETGVVSGVALGTTNITVTSDDYPSATMTCAITVSNKKVIDFTSGYAVAKPASAQSELSTVEINGYELNLLNCHNNNGSAYDYMMFATSQLKTGDSLISNKTPLPGYISKIIFKIKSGSAVGAVYKATLSDSEVTAKVTSSTYSRTGEGNLVITANPNDNFRYFAISCSTSGSNGQLESVDIYYREPAAKELISEIDTLASLSYSNYTKVSENNYTFTDLCIRFGGFVSQDLWDGLDNIQGYGVILSNGNDEIEDLYNAAKDEGDTVEEALAEICDGTNIKEFYSALTQSKTHPAEATTEQKEYMGVDTGDTYYIWTLGKGVSNENLTTVYNVVAYIIFDNDIVFLNSAKESSKTLASALIAAGAYEEDAFGGSLKYLKDLSVLP